MERSRRLPSALRNFTVGALAALLSGIVIYASRIVFLSKMDVEYVGYTALFEHAFILLSSLDLGITSSLTSYMASKMAGGKEEEERGALEIAKRIYVGVSLLILLSGTIFAFFFSLVENKNSSVFFSCLFYFTGQCAQYLFGWRVLAMNVEGRNDIVSIFVQGGRILSYTLGTLLLVITGSFLIYSLVSSLFVFLSFFFLHIYSVRIIPWMKGKTVYRNKNDEKRLLLTLPAMGMHRIGSVFFRAYEIIAVTFLFGAREGGKYSNLLMVSTALLTVFWIIQSSLTGIVGEHYAKENVKDSWKLFSSLSRWNYLLSLALGLGFVVFGTKIAVLSFGEANVPGKMVGSIMGIELFLLSSRTSSLIMRDAEGEYVGDWWKTILEIVFALGLNLLFRERMESAAVPLSISISLLFVTIPVENYIVSEKMEKGSGRKRALFSLFLAIFGIVVVSVASVVI